MRKTAKILVLADEPVKAFYEYYNEKTFEGIDLIISCGDLPARYLTFIADVFRGEVLYIPGNHDSSYLTKPPKGCVNIDGRIYIWRGLRILGLGGCYWYKPGPYQYQELEMNRRYLSLWYSFLKHRGIDILVTHAPAAGHNDGPDLPHKGFETFTAILDKYRPKYYFHGHVHMTYGDYPRLSMYGDTTVVNAYERYVVEVELLEDQKSKQHVRRRRFFSTRKSKALCEWSCRDHQHQEDLHPKDSSQKDHHQDIRENQESRKKKS